MEGVEATVSSGEYEEPICVGGERLTEVTLDEFGG